MLVQSDDLFSDTAWKLILLGFYFFYGKEFELYNILLLFDGDSRAG